MKVIVIYFRDCYHFVLTFHVAFNFFQQTNPFMQKSYNITICTDISMLFASILFKNRVVKC